MYIYIHIRIPLVYTFLHRIVVPNGPYASQRRRVTPAHMYMRASTATFLLATSAFFLKCVP